MPKRSSKAGKPEDANEAAFRVVREATEKEPEADEAPEEQPDEGEDQDEGKNPAAVALGRLGGKKGGPARAKKLSAERRSEIARKAANAMWAKRRAAESEG